MKEDYLKGFTCPTCSRKFATPAGALEHARATHLNRNWMRQQAAKKPSGPICPICGGQPTISQAKYGTKATCCGLWSWNRKPLVNRATHAARIRAHDAFDPLWQSGRMSRGEAYRRLQVVMEMTSAECHISLMSERAALRVVDLIGAGRLLDKAFDRVAA